MKRLQYILFFLFVAFFIVSCHEGEFPGSSTGKENCVSLKIDLPGTRATIADTEIESELTQLDVLIYHYNSDAKYVPFHYERFKVTDTPDGLVTLNKRKTDFVENGRYIIYTVANSKLDEEAFVDGAGNIISHDAFLKLEQRDDNVHLTGVGHDVNNPHYPQQFLMDGVAYLGNIEPQAPSPVVVNDGDSDEVTLKVKLRRAVAKFVVKIYTGENTVITPELMTLSDGYMLRNMPIRTRLVAQNDYPSTNGGKDPYWKSTTISQSPYFNMLQDGDGNNYMELIAYCYSHSWVNDEFFEKGTSLVFMLPIEYTETVDGVTTTTTYVNNYYQLLLNKRESNGNTYKIKRNTLYELRVVLNAPGAEDYVKPYEIEAIDYFATPWTEKTLDVSGESAVKYLKVNKDTVNMYNTDIDSTSLHFSSSSPVTLSIVSNSAYYIDKYGAKKTITPSSFNIGATAPADVNSGGITVRSAVPVNNTNRYFTIRVTNKEGLKEDVVVKQTPLIYITNSLPWYSYREDFYYNKNSGHSYTSGCNKDNDSKTVPTTYSVYGDKVVAVKVKSVSNGKITYEYNNSGGSGYFFSSKVRGDDKGGGKYASNFYNYSNNNVKTSQCESSTNLRNYHIRMTATSGDYILGRPRMDENGQTASDAENAKLVSPSFVIASRLGAVYTTSDGMSKLSAEDKRVFFADHAKNYVEVDDIGDKKDKNNVVVYDNWRLPTEAEIKIIIELQGGDGVDADAIDFLLNGVYYMSASGPVYNPKNTDGVKESDTSKKNDVAIRCVRDVYY